MRSWKLMAELEGKTPMERFRAIQNHLAECKSRYAQAESDLIEAERMMRDASRDYMAEYFPDRPVK